MIENAFIYKGSVEMTISKIRQAGIVLSMVGIGLSSSAYAQYTGPSAMADASVATILQNPVDDQNVQLQGHLLRKIGSDKYIFSDGTGEIVAEIKDKRLPNQSFNETTKIEIVGEVDTGFTRPPEIEVDVVRILN